jgi:beta-galactosidase GanA
MGGRISRRSFLYTAGVALGATATPASPVGTPTEATAGADAVPFFPFGTHVYREPSLPLEQIRADLPLLKQLGFNTIKVQECWADDEQQEGMINLSKVARVVSDARDYGLRVYFGVTMELAPAWFWAKFPDASLVYETGEPHNDQLQYVIPADGKPGPCWHHPEARKAAIEFIEAVGKQIGNYENVLAWNVWQEIGFWPMRPGHMGFCCCPHTLDAYRLWLRKRFGSVDKLNAAWLSGYGSFEEVVPPRFAADAPPYIDFRYFMDDVYLTEVLAWKAEAFRRSDPHHRPVFAHQDKPVVGSTQHWRHARALDFFGGSEYPAWEPMQPWDAGHPRAGHAMDPHLGKHAELWDSVLMRFDCLRNATPGGKIWVAELQGGPVVRGLHRRRVPDAGDIRRWILGSLAAGVQGISFWNHRAEILWREEYGFGLLDLEGDEITPRAEEAGRLAKAINTQASLFAEGTCPHASAAMVLNEDLYHFHESTHKEAYFASPLDHLQQTIRGTYKSLWDLAIPLDFVSEEEIVSRGAQYKALLLPFPVALSASVIEGLRTYVQKGGVLISEACPGRLTQYGVGIPGQMMPGLPELFGVAHGKVVIVREPNDGAIWTGEEVAYGDTEPYRDLVGAGEFGQYTMMPAYCLQTVIPNTAIPILLDRNDVAGCVNRYGQGHAYLIGTLLGHATLSYNDQRNAKFLARVLASAGVFPDAVGKLQRRRRVLGDKAAWFLFNVTDKAVEEEVFLEGFHKVSDLLGEDFAQSAGKVAIKVPPMDICCLVLERKEQEKV